MNIKRLKKLVYKNLFLSSGLLKKNVVWQASTELEAEDIRREVGGRVEVRIAGNLNKSNTEFNAFTHEFPKRNGSKLLNVVFISRISKKKNLDYALRIISELRTELRFDIYGPIDDADYWKECLILIKKIPGHIKVRYCGELNHQFVKQKLAEYDLFFLPTWGENFGHAIFEALSVGTPVIISDQTIWKHDGMACVALPLTDEQGFVQALEEFGQMNEYSWEQRRNRALKMAEQVIRDPERIQANRILFEPIH